MAKPKDGITKPAPAPKLEMEKNGVEATERPQMKDAPLIAANQANHYDIVSVRRVDLEHLFKDYWLLKGRDEAVAEALAVVSTQNMDTGGDPMTEATGKLDYVIRLVREGKAVGFGISVIHNDNTMATMQHLEEGSNAVTLLGAIDILKARLTHMLMFGRQN